MTQEVNKVQHPVPVLFPELELQAKHTEALQAIFKGESIPEGGPFCVCAPKAALAALNGVPVPCSELPWYCPFGFPKESTPTT